MNLNRMRINIFLLVVHMLLLTSLSAYSQQTPTEAETVMNRTAEAFRQAGGIKATFTVRAREGVSEGTIYLKGEKFVLESAGVKTWFDGRTQWSYVASNDEVNITEPTAEELQTLNPYAWLYMYKQGYKLKMGKNNAAAKSAYEVVMNAADLHQDLQCIILYVAKDTYRPLKISMAQRGGKNATLIVVNDFQTGQSYSDRFFTFDKKAYPSAEEIDLR